MQMSLFVPSAPPADLPVSAAPVGAAVAPPVIDDLAGLLAGPAQLARGRDSARLSVLLAPGLDAPEVRAQLLCSAFRDRGLVGEVSQTLGRRTVVRTEFSPLLSPLAAAWTRGAVKSPPDDFVFSAAALRWWGVAAGSCSGTHYQFGLAESDSRCWQQLGKALRAIGFPAQLMSVRAGGPAWRLQGVRRLGALRALMGPAPVLPDGDSISWPAG